MENIEEIYRVEYSRFDRNTKRLKQLIETILISSKLNFHLVESRTKSIDSFCEKVKRKKDKYINPLNDITDICALRIIVYYIDDLEKIKILLKENFLIDEENSYEAKNNMTENEFGYLSSHFVISLKKDRSKLPEWSPYKDIKTEVQVRTVLQHAWASISHELEYKKNYEIPSILKRKLYRLAGLIELADEEFQEAREKHNAVELAIKNDDSSIYDKKVYEEINLNTIKNYFEKNTTEISVLENCAIKAGFEIDNSSFTQTERNKFFSDIIRICDIKGISTIDKFSLEMNRLKSNALSKLTRIYQKDNLEWIGSTEFVILLLLIVSLNKSQLEKYGNSSWYKKLWDTFVEIISEN